MAGPDYGLHLAVQLSTTETRLEVVLPVRKPAVPRRVTPARGLRRAPSGDGYVVRRVEDPSRSAIGYVDMDKRSQASPVCASAALLSQFRGGHATPWFPTPIYSPRPLRHFIDRATLVNGVRSGLLPRAHRGVGRRGLTKPPFYDLGVEGSDLVTHFLGNSR
ncbi:hypothetical protein GGTG_14297 [Gaeumannomyces tritici R3-111a-1]|uniref:Uncharacterized protein n=1 Tax=Gaeumannomyces tritici (strain R3-111a-1) TaxID=644352 RepID=J3PL52_GAET3|nr:hypothetical protein GGTG_14297 [Gaeumannomyces tritici R3-111a-1]EJT68125.1 hypothetical protein GGTG_14297 [Gaeumannomyces tritici R3-111a-1]